MTSELWSAVALFAVVVVVVAAVIVVRRRPRKLDRQKFAKNWAALQKLCADKSSWNQAVIQADDLLDLALRKKGVRGKSTGERMVHIQRQFTDNDNTWYGHKLRRQLDAEPQKRLTQKEVKNALVGIRQALKDIGALPNGKSGKK
jgi:hypothetical protein